MDYLKKNDKRTLHLTLNAYSFLLSKGGEHTLKKFEDMGGLDLLEELQKHSC